MTRPPGYIERVTIVLDALDSLRTNGPAAVADLAERLHCQPEQLRADLGQLLEAGLVDVTEGDEYAVTGLEPLRALGLDRMSVSDAVALIRVGRAWQELDDDSTLADALDALEQQILVEPANAPTSDADGHGRLLLQAASQHRAVRLVYARAWRPGVVERVVHPYRLELTGRGWECDAGPLDEHNRPRTYLLSGIREVELLADHVEPPGLIAQAVMHDMRTPRTVTLVLPQGSRWVAERYSEAVRVVRQDDDLELECDLLAPVEERVGLILATAGPQAMAIDPDLQDAGARYARRLLEQYQTR